jgi:hypothetical protein
MTKDEALKQALEALGEIEWSNNSQWQSDRAKVAITAIKEALAQPEQEPVAMLERDPSIGRLRVTYEDAVTELDEGMYPLYTAPPQRPWVGLTGQEKELIASVSLDVHDAVHRTDAKLKEKNT